MIKVREDGTVVHELLRVRKNVTKPQAKKPTRVWGRPREWPNLETFMSWRARHLKQR